MRSTQRFWKETSEPYLRKKVHRAPSQPCLADRSDSFLLKMQEREFTSNRAAHLDANNYFVQSLRPSESRKKDADRLVLMPIGKRHPDDQLFIRVKKFSGKSNDFFLKPNLEDEYQKGLKDHFNGSYYK